MSRIDRIAALSLMLALAAPALAQTRTPGPEYLTVFDDRIRMGARIVTSQDGAPAAEVATTDWLRLELGFITSADVAHGKVRLRCDTSFAGPDGAGAQTVRSAPCWQGDLAEVAGKWVPMPDANLRFHPERTDPNGRWFVRVVVRDDVTGHTATLTPSYTWTGGTR